MKTFSRRSFMTGSAAAGFLALSADVTQAAHGSAGSAHANRGQFIDEAFGLLAAGDVRQKDGKLTFHPNGHGEFTSTVWTEHSGLTGDVLHAEFHVFNAHNALLFKIGTHDSERLHGHPSPHKSFNFNFDFPPQHYPAIARVVEEADG